MTLFFTKYLQFKLLVMPTGWLLIYTLFSHRRWFRIVFLENALVRLRGHMFTLLIMLIGHASWSVVIHHARDLRVTLCHTQ